MPGSPGLRIFLCPQDGKCILSETLNVTTRAFLTAPYHWLKFTIEFDKQIGVAEVDLATLKNIDVSLKVDEDLRFPRWNPKAQLSEWSEKRLIFVSNHDKNNIEVSVNFGRDSPLGFTGAWKRGQDGLLKFCLEISGHQVCIKIHFFAEVKKTKRVQLFRKRKRSKTPESMAAAEPEASQSAAAACASVALESAAAVSNADELPPLPEIDDAWFASVFE